MAKAPTVRKRRAQRKLNERKRKETVHTQETWFREEASFEVPLPYRGSGMCLQLCCGEAPQMVRIGR